MLNRSCDCKKNTPVTNKCRKKSDLKSLGFIMWVFGIVSICAFFLPIKAWIVLLGVLLIYCGFKLRKY